MPTLLSDFPTLQPNDLLVVGCLRNERLRLPDFLAHHRRIGVNQFLLIDNESDDGSREFLRQQKDVTLFATSERYSESKCGVTWLNAVLNEYALGHWVLVLDTDELFIFPGFEKVNLRDFTNYISEQGNNAVLAPMLDMYSDKPIRRTNYQEGSSLIETCAYFDGDGYILGNSKQPFANLPHRGGPRHRLFWEPFRRGYPSPVLSKIPLFKWKQEFSLEASTHILRGAKLARTTGVLLHFKLLQDFAENVEIETVRKEHFLDARQYAVYHEVMSSAAELTAYFENSVLFQNSEQLVRLGLMQTEHLYPFLNENPGCVRQEN